MKLSRHNILKKAAQILTASVILAGAATSLLLSGCAADDFNLPADQSQYSSDTQLVITLAVPHGERMPVRSTRANSESDFKNDAPDFSAEPSQSSESDELKINSLRLYIFPANSEDAAPAINAPLLIPSKVLSDDSGSVTYEINGLKTNEEYRLYLLANFGSEVEGFAKASDLETKVIDYTNDAHNLRPGNLPMVYRSSGTFKIEPPTDGNNLQPLSITATMQYACVKLRYNIIFDNSDEVNKIDGLSAKDNFGSNKLIPSETWLSNVTKTSKIICDNISSFYTAPDNTEMHSTLTLFKYFSDFTENPDAADEGEDVVVGTTEMDASAVASADRWLLQGTTYVPERYVENLDNQLTLHLDSKLNGATECKHSGVIGIGDKKNLDRGAYYEFIGRIVNTGLQGILWTCNVIDWEDKTISADFIHTFLTLNTTSTTVTSFENGEIEYDTDGRGEIGFECADNAKVNGKNLFELVPLTASDGQKKLQIRVSSKVSITDASAAGKTGGPDTPPATCFITAGNIKKQIDVYYDIQPFFEITPSKIKIQDGDGINDSDRYFEYRTNLGGFTLTSKSLSGWGNFYQTSTSAEHKVGDGTDESKKSNVTLSMGENSSEAAGKIMVTGTPALTTVVHEFYVTPKTDPADRDGNTIGQIPVSVEVMPTKQNYRIYFRAINDYQEGNDDEFLHLSNYTLPSESQSTGSTNNNWIDYWNHEDRTSNEIGYNNYRHRIYAYTQYGQDANTQPVWAYTTGFGGWDDKFKYQNPENDEVITTSTGIYPIMTADVNNPGWYYYDIPVRCKGVYNTELQTEATKPGTDLYKKYGNGPLPGATLLIFYNDEKNGQSRHRVNQNNAPGIPLGDDSDNETWVLYDPSREPVYTVYNDKPVIEDVTYTIYSDKAFSEWWHDYGNCNIHGGSNTLKSQSDNKNGYNYKYTIAFKAPSGEYDKAISLKYPQTITRPTVAVGLYNVNLSDWGIPYALFAKEEKEQIWVEMKLIPSQSQEYYIEVPSGYESGTVKFCSHDKTRYDDNNGSGYGTPSANVLMMTWTNNTNWEQKDDKIKFGITLMFGGRNWKTGYFKDGSWKRNP